MRHFDRLLLAVLAIGVWSLVLRPTVPTAHDFNRHSCEVRGDLRGRLEHTEVVDGQLKDGRVRIDGVERLAVDCRHR